MSPIQMLILLVSSRAQLVRVMVQLEMEVLEMEALAAMVIMDLDLLWALLPSRLLAPVVSQLFSPEALPL